jgi:hypothetical protein
MSFPLQEKIGFSLAQICYIAPAILHAGRTRADMAPQHVFNYPIVPQPSAG